MGRNPHDGTVVIVTGGSSGIGKVLCSMLAEKGAKVVVSDVNEDTGSAFVNELRDRGLEATFIRCNVTEEEDVKNLIDGAVAKYGRIDGAVNNAGIIGRTDFARTVNWAVDELDAVMRVNVRGVFLCLKYEIIQFRKQLRADKEAGRPRRDHSIVNSSSLVGLRATKGQCAYTASKHAVMGLTRSAALEYAHCGIRVNSINPGVLRTPMTAVGADMTIGGKSVSEMLAANHPMKRLGEPDDAARAACFLLSPENSFVTGTALSVDGGLNL